MDEGTGRCAFIPDHKLRSSVPGFGSKPSKTYSLPNQSRLSDGSSRSERQAIGQQPVKIRPSRYSETLLSNIDRNRTRECYFKRFGGRRRLLFEYHPPGGIRLKSHAMVNKNKSNRRPQRSRRVWARTVRRLSVKRNLVKASSGRRRRSGLSLSQRRLKRGHPESHLREL